jgi:hypothetical protein
MSRHPITAGMDIGDRHRHLCLLHTESGEVIEESKCPVSPRCASGDWRLYSAHDSEKLSLFLGPGGDANAHRGPRRADETPTLHLSAGGYTDRMSRCFAETDNLS